MRRLGALCICLGLAAPALAGPGDPPPAEETPSVPWYRWLFLGERDPKPPVPPKKDQPPAPTARDRAPSPAARESAKEAAARQFDQEQRVYLQRLQAITKIRQVAAEQNDEAALTRADQLEEQATEIFNQRTARLMAVAERDDRAALERGRDDRPATAQKPAPRRRTTGGTDR
jgi:hypothetical protein